jgi:NADH-quinone oxidoreductase subunit L
LQVILAHLSAWVDTWVVDGVLVGCTSRLSAMLGGLLGRWQSGKLASYWVLVFITFGLFLLFSLLI